MPDCNANGLCVEHSLSLVMDTQESQNMNGILMYCETLEDDWNGVRVVRRAGNRPAADK